MSQEAKFRFNGYKIEKSLIDIELFKQENNSIDIDFDYAGVDNKVENTFQLKMLVNLTNKESTLKIQVLIASLFDYSEDSNSIELDNFFYCNAPAIVYPYIRSYIAALSTLSGLSIPITLPTLNLTSEGDKLKQNTRVINK